MDTMLVAAEAVLTETRETIEGLTVSALHQAHEMCHRAETTADSFCQAHKDVTVTSKEQARQKKTARFPESVNVLPPLSPPPFGPPTLRSSHPTGLPPFGPTSSGFFALHRLGAPPFRTFSGFGRRDPQPSAMFLISVGQSRSWPQQVVESCWPKLVAPHSVNAATPRSFLAARALEDRRKERRRKKLPKLRASRSRKSPMFSSAAGSLSGCWLSTSRVVGVGCLAWRCSYLTMKKRPPQAVVTPTRFPAQWLLLVFSTFQALASLRSLPVWPQFQGCSQRQRADSDASFASAPMSIAIKADILFPVIDWCACPQASVIRHAWPCRPCHWLRRVSRLWQLRAGFDVGFESAFRAWPFTRKRVTWLKFYCSPAVNLENRSQGTGSNICEYEPPSSWRW